MGNKGKPIVTYGFNVNTAGSNCVVVTAKTQCKQKNADGRKLNRIALIDKILSFGVEEISLTFYTICCMHRGLRLSVHSDAAGGDWSGF